MNIKKPKELYLKHKILLSKQESSATSSSDGLPSMGIGEVEVGPAPSQGKG